MSEFEAKLSEGLQHLREGRSGEALTAFNNVLEKDPDNSVALLHAGKLLVAQNSAETAIEHLQRAVAADPNNAEVRYVLGIAFSRAARLDEALGALQQSLSLNENYTEALNALGAIHFSSGELGESAKCFMRIIEIDPRNAQALGHLGNISFESGEFEKAAAYYEAAIDLDGNRPSLYFDLGTAHEILGNDSKAEEAFRRAVELDPDHVESLQHWAAILLQRGEYAEANEMLGRCLSLSAGMERTCKLLGRAALAAGDSDTAITHFQAAVSHGGSDADIYNDLGASLQNKGRHDEALEAFQEALKLEPLHGPAHNNMGQSLMALDRLEDALLSSRFALEVEPTSGAFLRGMGVILGKLNRHAEAIDYLEKSLDVDPTSMVGLMSLSTVHSNAGDTSRSREALLRGLEMEPNNANFRRRLALSYMDGGDNQSAVDVGIELVRDEPENVKAHIALAYILSAALKTEEALEVIDRALSLDPDHIDGLQVRVTILGTLKKHGDALKTLLHLLELQPNSTKIVGQIVDLVLTLCEWDRASKFTETLVDVIRMKVAESKAIGVCVNNLQALPLSYEFIVEAARNVAVAQMKKAGVRQFGGQLKHPPPDQRSAKNGRIRIGYLLPYVHFHSLPLILKNIVETHDREQFEVYGYCTGLPSVSEFAQTYTASFDVFKFTGNVAIATAREIHSDEIDILIDVAGQTLTNCMEVLAFKPAPICIHYLGYSISTGAEYVDYIITDEIYIPPADMALGPEMPIYMPPTFLATAKAEIGTGPVSRAKEGLPEDGFVFCNFNQPFKLEPEIFSVWMNILKRVPGSVFWLGNWSQETADNLLQTAAEHDMPRERLVFGRIVSHKEHLNRLSLADLALDTHYHGGGVTTVDCLWAGLPILCTPGGTPSARLGKSILTAADLEQLVAADLKDYEETAVAWALDPSPLRAIRDDWWPRRESSRLFDTKSYVRLLEEGFSLAWQNYLEGCEPRALQVGEGVSERIAGAG